MIFVVIEVEDGGASDQIYDTKDDVMIFLNSSPYWQRNAQEFFIKEFKPGDMFHFPSGWIFAVNEEES